MLLLDIISMFSVPVRISNRWPTYIVIGQEIDHRKLLMHHLSAQCTQLIDTTHYKLKTSPYVVPNMGYTYVILTFHPQVWKRNSVRKLPVYKNARNIYYTV